MTAGTHSEQPVTEALDEQAHLHEENRGRKLPSARYGQQNRASRSHSGSAALGLAQTFERHYSVKELAELWNLSERTIRRMFVHEAGVLEWGTPETRMKRGYRTIRIPETVAQRVYRKLRKAG